TRWTYSSGLIRSSHGARQRPSSARAHAGVGVRGERRRAHWRSGTASYSPAATSSAARRPANGPRYTPPSAVTVRTTDSRGYGSAVSLSHSTRWGNFDLRL